MKKVCILHSFLNNNKKLNLRINIQRHLKFKKIIKDPIKLIFKTILARVHLNLA